MIELKKPQKEAISKISEFIDKGHPQSWFTLIGKAGTGKTTTLVELIGKYNKTKKIVVSAISHKAKNVLRDKCFSFMKSNRGMNTVDFCSVASMLGMKFDEVSGEFIYEKIPYIIRPIDRADIIIVDECSMIDENTLSLILENKKHNAKVIFAGDMAQLQPIRNTDCDLESPTFNTDNEYRLFERLRQGDESPILPFSDFYWNTIMGNDDLVHNMPRDSIFNNNGNIHFCSRVEAIDSVIGVFKKSIDTNDSNLIKVVCYKNDSRIKINEYIRRSIYGDSVNEFEINDFIIMMNNFSLDEYNVIENSMEFQITDIYEFDDYIEGEKIKVYNITVDYKIGRDNVTIPVVAKESMSDFNRIVSNLFNEAKLCAPRSKARTMLFKKAYSLKNKFADISYAYCLTSHKAQGSTYKCVLVYESDIMSVIPISLKTKYRSMYTAITRGSQICIIIN